jgi:hypothetical protein
LEYLAQFFSPPLRGQILTVALREYLLDPWTRFNPVNGADSFEPVAADREGGRDGLGLSLAIHNGSHPKRLGQRLGFQMTGAGLGAVILAFSRPNTSSIGIGGVGSSIDSPIVRRNSSLRNSG